MADLHQFGIPTPFNIGRVNCYLIDAREVTLIDPGPATEAAHDELISGLRNRGLAVRDIDRVLLTHPHMDHFGLAVRIVEESGAATYAHRDAATILEDPLVHYDREKRVFRPFLRAMGVPEQLTNTAVTLPEAYVDYQEAVAVDHELTDGDVIDLGGPVLTSIHTPGHAPGSVCFVREDADYTFTGDHVLQHISPNPLLTVRPGTANERTRSLPTYLDSLWRIREVDTEVGHAGHDGRIPDLDARAQAIIDHHHERKEHIAELLDAGGPASAYDLMKELFPDLPATEVFPGMSEVIGHLDMLEDESRVVTADDGGVRKYTLE